jgi:excisionase family DNA binding protein
MINEAYLTVQEAAARLRMHPSTVRIWLREGKLHGTRLPAAKLGWRIPSAEVERVLKGSTAGIDTEGE